LAEGWSVYILKCGDGTLYTGVTTDLARRLAAHQRGRASKYTRSRLPVLLAYSEPCESRGAAQRREAEIKRLSRAAKRRLIGAEIPDTTNAANSAVRGVRS